MRPFFKIMVEKRRINKYTLLAALIPLLLLSMYAVIAGIYPFGDKTFLRYDMYHQYFPIFAEFRRKLVSGENIFYSFNAGMGTNFYAMYVYYLSSPLNLLSVFVPEKLLTEFMTVLIFIKLAISSLSMQLYLSHNYKKENILTCIGGLMFAFSSYMIAYNWNIMWLDAIMVFPLIVLGAEELFFKDKWLLYIISLTYAIFTSYYISIMICIFMFLWFFYLVFTSCKSASDFFFKLLRFFVASILSIGLCAVMLVPEYFALCTSISAEVGDIGSPKALVNVIELLRRFLLGQRIIIGIGDTVDSNLPNIYCGMAVLILLPSYFLVKSIPRKERILKAALLIIFLISFIFNYPYFIWHGMHYPHSLPARQAFIFIFFVITLSFEAAEKRFELGLYKRLFLVILAFLYTVFIIAEGKETNIVIYVLPVTFLILYGLIYVIRGYDKRFIKRLLLISVTMEAFTALCFTGTLPSLSFEKLTKRIESARSLLEEEYASSSAYYRTKWDEDFITLYGMALGVPTASLFSSTSYGSFTKTYKAYGLCSSDNLYLTRGSTPLMDMLLSIKYKVVSDNTLNEDTSYWSEIKRDGEVVLYENKLFVPPLYFVLEDEGSYSIDSEKGSSENQNALASYLAETNSKVILVKDKNLINSFTIKKKEANRYFIKLYDENIWTIKASITHKGETLDTIYTMCSKGFFIDLGYLDEGDKVELSTLYMVGDNELQKEIKFNTYVLDFEEILKVKEAIEQRNDIAGVDIYKWSAGDIGLRVDSRQDGELHLTVPFDKGWSLKIDGKNKVLEADSLSLIKIPIKKGEHLIEISYVPSGFYMGAAITIITILILFAVFGIRRSRKMQNR